MVSVVIFENKENAKIVCLVGISRFLPLHIVKRVSTDIPVFFLNGECDFTEDNIPKYFVKPAFYYKKLISNKFF